MLSLPEGDANRAVNVVPFPLDDPEPRDMLEGLTRGENVVAPGHVFRSVSSACRLRSARTCQCSNSTNVKDLSIGNWLTQHSHGSGL
eukprot:15476080-Alexandrium_andersonii.AAC.1